MDDSPGRPLGLLSVVAPVHDEAGNLEELHQRITAALAPLTDFELILVDDGSTDGSSQLIDRLAAADARVKALHLTRSFGHQAALTAGLDRARGDAVVTLDADLQDPPELIPTLVEHYRRGSEVVYAVRRSRPGETRFKRGSAAAFYRLLGRLADLDVPADAGDFRLLGRRALDDLLELRERARFLRGMTVWIGHTQTAVAYDRDPRGTGTTKFSLRRMASFGLDGLTSFTRAPLQAATLLGFGLAGLAFLLIPLTVIARFTDQFVPGVPSTILLLLLLGGVQLITLGIVGEYVGRIYEEVKQRPLYLVRDDERGGEPPTGS